MHAASRALRVAAILAFFALFFAGAASAQRDLPALPPSRPPSPTQAYVGRWQTDTEASRTITIRSSSGSTILVSSPGFFEAAGFASANTAVTLMRTPPWAGDPNAGFDLSCLWLQRVDANTLRVRYTPDLHSAATREETWKLHDALPPPGPEPLDGTALPAFGEYVYVEELPEAVTKVTPVYPDLARESGVAGEVLVQALVGRDGRVQDTRVVKSIPMLDAAAEAAVKQWVFKPALTRGKPVAVWVAVPVMFHVH